ncbi:hypothetical protein BVRB_2g038410 [Beta vulgaris subsp. vulgaris]|nr:hypothetical protein BVRB_2g038410 [Beta vulgaris subsp. vulgaris]
MLPKFFQNLKIFFFEFIYDIMCLFKGILCIVHFHILKELSNNENN